MKFLKHIGDSLVALMAATDLRLAHFVGDGLPTIASGGQNHQSQEASRRQAERLASDEPDFDQITWFGEVLTVARLQGVRHPHRAARHRDISDVCVCDVSLVFQGESSGSISSLFLTSNQFARQDSSGL